MESITLLVLVVTFQKRCFLASIRYFTVSRHSGVTIDAWVIHPATREIIRGLPVLHPTVIKYENYKKIIKKYFYAFSP